jgi:thiosulfate/3-mercaptopyruvate sulfurtransferase
VTAVVSTDWLAGHLSDPDLRVVDASFHLPALGRDARAEHAACRIPGAVYLDIDEVADPDHALPHTLPPGEVFAARVGALGIANRHHLVAYDSRGLYSAARVWWMFRVYGHDRVSVLDGGLPKWLSEERPLESGAPAPAAETFAPAPPRDLVRTWEEVRANLASGAAQVIDARDPARFAGAPRPIPIRACARAATFREAATSTGPPSSRKTRPCPRRTRSAAASRPQASPGTCR